MPRAKQLTVSVPDRPGVLGAVGSALGAKKANIRAFTAWIEGDRGRIRLVVDKTAAAKKLLAANGWEAIEEEVLAVTLADNPGSLGRTAKKLGDAGVNIEYAYAGTAGSARRVTVYLGVSDIKAALKAAR
ncbi:MAG: ACT domain-containing protein [Chloroflexi bacterium]|nr:MAG: ACT domain-containing protein [Chloroflexota bacterium]